MTAYISLFISAFTSATLLPGTSEVLLLALLAGAQADPLILVLVATSGNVLGSCVNWILGRYFARFHQHRWFPIKAPALKRAEIWYGRYGIWLLLLAWVPVIGDPLTVFAGIFRVPFWRFLLLVSLGKLARYVFVAGLGAFAFG